MGKGAVLRADDKRIGNNFGRPPEPKYKTVRQLKQKFNAYFDSIKKVVIEEDDEGNVLRYETYIRPPTLQRLALFCGMTGDGLRESIYKYKRNHPEFEEFKNLYEMAKAECLAYNVDQLIMKPGSTKGVEFILKNNYGWEEKVVQESSIEAKNSTFKLENLSAEQLEQYEALQIAMQGEIENEEKEI